MCVFEPNHLQMPWEVLAGFVCAASKRETFHKRAVFQRTTNAILNLGVGDRIWTVYTSECWLTDISPQCLPVTASQESKGTCF